MTSSRRFSSFFLSFFCLVSVCLLFTLLVETPFVSGQASEPSADSNTEDSHPCRGFNAFRGTYVEMQEAGQRFLEQNKLIDAEDCFREAAGKKPRYAGAWADLASVQKSLGKNALSVAHYEKSIKLNAKVPAVWVNLGNAYRDLGETTKAFDAYNKALALAPQMAAVHNNLGIAYYEMGFLEKAYHSFQAAVKLDPELADAQYNLGNIFRDHGSISQAIVQYQTALRYAPREKRYFLNAGICFQNLNRFSMAEENLLTALEIDPNYPEALFNLGGLYYGRGRFNESLSYFSKAISLKENFTDALLFAARSSRLIGDYLKAMVFAQEILAIYPNATTAIVEIGRDVSECAQYDMVRSIADAIDDSIHNSLVRDADRYDRMTKRVVKPGELIAPISPSIEHQDLIYGLGLEPKLVKISKELLANASSIRAKSREMSDFISLGRDGYPDEKDDDDKLVVGFVVHNFHVSESMLESLAIAAILGSSETLKVVVYGFGEAFDESVLESWLAVADKFVNLFGKPPETLLNRINDDGIHIAFYVDVFNSFFPMDIIAVQPAPIQMALGSDGRTMLSGVHFLIADKYVLPSWEKISHSSEQLIELPLPLSLLPLPVFEPRPRLRHSRTESSKGVFAYFGDLQYLDYDLVKLWAQLLLDFPDWSLRVCSHNDDQQDLVVQGLKSLGISFDQQEVRRCAPRSLNLEADNLEDSLWEGVTLYLDARRINDAFGLREAVLRRVPFVSFADDIFSTRRYGLALSEYLDSPLFRTVKTIDTYKRAVVDIVRMPTSEKVSAVAMVDGVLEDQVEMSKLRDSLVSAFESTWKMYQKAKPFSSIQLTL